MSKIVKRPQQVDTTVDPGLENVYNRELETFYNPANEITGTSNNVVIQNVTQVVTTVIQNKAPTGANGSIQFNEGGDFTSDLQLTYDPVSDTLTTGTIVVDGIVATKQGIINVGDVGKLRIYGGNYNDVSRYTY